MFLVESSLSPQTQDTRLGLRILTLLNRVLGHKYAHRWIIATSALILCLSLDTGFSADDYVHSLMLDGGRDLHGFSGRSPWDIFRFTTPEITPQLQRDGVMPWWDDPRSQVTFLRPVSAATHMLDHALFPHSAALQHLHSVLWGIIVFLGVWALYQQLMPPGLLLGLSTFLYVLDDARAWFSSWIAGRNTVVATACSIWVLAFYVSYRRTGMRRAAVAALVLWPLSLLAGEGSVAIGAYMLAYALFLDQAPRAKALSALVPYVVVGAVWRIAYKALGYGAAHSLLYVDPADDPITFIERLFERGPVLWLSQLGGPWSDNWSSFFVFPKFRIALYISAWFALLICGALLRPLVKREPILKFAALGAALSTLTATAAFPADRLLNWISIGASPLLAHLMVACLKVPARGSLASRFTAFVGGYMVIVHLIVGPLVMTSRARGNVAIRDVLERCDAGVPKDPSIRNKKVLFVNPPALPLASYIPVMRAERSEPRAKSQLVLGVSTVPLTLRRIDDNTLELSATYSLLWNPGSQMGIGPRTRFAPGDKRTIGDAQIVVRTVDERGGPLSYTVHLPHSLDDSNYLFLQWAGTTYKPLTPPAIGRSVTLPAADYLQTLLGTKIPIEAKFPEP